MELKELQEKVDRWIKEYGVRYFNELTNMTILTEEVGELARVMARKYGEQSFKPGERKIWPMRWPMYYGYLPVWPIKRESILQKLWKRISPKKRAET